MRTQKPAYDGIEYSSNLSVWCQQLGATSDQYTVEVETRATDYCVYWSTGHDSSDPHWKACGVGSWYDGVLNLWTSSRNDYITSITCDFEIQGWYIVVLFILWPDNFSFKC